MNKKKYWDLFYKTQVNKIKLNHPSQFAIFTIGEAENITSLVEFGCGNGRDALFFSNHFKKVYALDGSNQVINKNKKQYSKINNLKFLKFNLNDKFDKHQILLNEKKAIYARFFLHALTNNEIKLFISLCADLLKKMNFYILNIELKKIKKDTKKHINITETLLVPTLLTKY